MRYTYCDTAAMLDPLAADTNSLSDRIDKKLNISDTASMLADYINQSDTMLDRWQQIRTC
jgi:hypothetical protein